LGKTAVDRIIDISQSGRAFKNDPAILALAIAASLGGKNPTRGEIEVRKYALANLPLVCRTGTHLFLFAEYVKKMRGFGRSLKEGISNWYLSKEQKNLAFQVLKYQQRNGWSHRDLLRLSHPTTSDRVFNSIFKYITKKEAPSVNSRSHAALRYIDAYEKMKAATTENDVARLVMEYSFPEECIPSEMRTPGVLETIIYDKNEKGFYTAGMTWLIRNLGRFSVKGMLGRGSQLEKFLVERFNDTGFIKYSRIHPMTILIALKTYSTGRGRRGSLTWTPNAEVLEAMDSMFYKSFDAIEATGKRYLLGVDVSASMSWTNNQMYQDYGITPREAAAVMAMVSAKTEKKSFTVGFSTTLVDLNINPNMILVEVIEALSKVPMGATNIGAPVEAALRSGEEFDVFIGYTDNDGNRGKQPAELIKAYREKTGIDAKLIMCAFTATNYSVADPNDPGMFDIVGFDPAIPSIISAFATNRF